MEQRQHAVAGEVKRWRRDPNDATGGEQPRRVARRHASTAATAGEAASIGEPQPCHLRERIN
jgi:hypothetical protein